MLFDLPEKKDFSLFKLRRKDLLKSVIQQYPDKEGLIVLFAGFESQEIAFRQESSFYYFTGIEEPAVVLTMDTSTGKTTLYVPNCGKNREQWVYSLHALTQENAAEFGIDEIVNLGEQCVGYQCYPFFKKNVYVHFLNRLNQIVENNNNIFTLCPSNEHEYIEQRLVLERLQKFIPNLQSCIIDISAIVASMRRKKDMREIELIYKAVDITQMAQEAAAQAIADGTTECEVQASLEYIITGSCARTSFPSIVASGKNGTILHYTANRNRLKNGDLVIVDIGAEYNNYCADLTRTYPVSGSFTKRQRELYDLVLAAQQYIADVAKPGYWLNNKERPEKSLHHLAKKFFAQKGYDQYFPHGIGHFLGLDVHDVGNYVQPLQEGDVITIEPGLYIPEENIGIRIEDDYWVVKEGVVCLSDNLPKKAEEIELLVQQNLTDEENAEQSSFDEYESEVEH